LTVLPEGHVLGVADRGRSPHTDRATGRPKAAVSGGHMLRWPFPS